MDTLNSQCLIQHSNGTSAFYGVRLNNYFLPSSCSNHKMYFGTLNDIKVFVNKKALTTSGLFCFGTSVHNRPNITA